MTYIGLSLANPYNLYSTTVKVDYSEAYEVI